MSIATMTRLASQATVLEGNAAAARQTRGVTRGGPGAARDAGVPEPPEMTALATTGSDPTTAIQSALEAIAGYIPSEALAIYITAVGILQPDSDTKRWFWLLVGMGVVVAFLALGALDRKVRAPINKTIIVGIFGLVSFAAYAGALPGSPFLQIDAQATAYAGIFALALSLVLPRLARILGVAPA
jgi:hypothetical protein